ncbi:hypothetical protein DL89DRAFT_295803 [Linderina pennispora]|uniref:Uncharacterized protein n=1 Tax=Linderina pennispora TaxID=61395 RepID=A0A1Y1VXD3_9FUNG|nr:uncharacterized protein DL89DRAFT_295803 [Linderina pennispora]ORX65940.1 hypothetical protein DL89DRAFT_295803 [Linderina pennispora]
MKSHVALLLLPHCIVAWNYKEKVFMYQAAETLTKFYTNSPDERVIYERLAMFLGDYGAVLGLRSDPTAQDYREALEKLMAHVERAKKEGKQGCAGRDQPGRAELAG